MEFMMDASFVEQILVQQASERRTPVNGSIELLPLCNMNCDMCYVRLSREEMERQGRLRTAEEWLEIGRQMQKQGVLFLLLTGGEPLMYPGFKELYLGLQKMGMILTINTNATLIDEEWVEFFSKHPARRINITLYGKDDETYERLCHYPGGFQKVTRAIQMLRERNIPVKVAMSITPENQKDIAKVHDIGDELGVPVRVDSYMMPAERERDRPFAEQNRLDPVTAARERIASLQREMGEELFDSYVKENLELVDQFEAKGLGPQKMSCLAGSCSFTINWQGEMRPCVVMTEPSVSVFEHGFSGAWKTLCEEVDKILTSSKCANCSLKPLCRTCAASALLETGSYTGVPAYMCQYAKESHRLLREYVTEKGGI